METEQHIVEWCVGYQEKTREEIKKFLEPNEMKTQLSELMWCNKGSAKEKVHSYEYLYLKSRDVK
jgi:hypothetical protein